MKTISQIFDTPLFETILKLHLTENKALNAPYHNFNHALTVTSSAMEIAEYCNLDKKNRDEIRIAALFHDFDHSMGEFKDNINVEIAIKKFIKWYDKNALSAYSKDNIINIILATQFPYVIDDKDLSLEQKIIRDADMTQLFEDNHIQQVYIGLSTELKMDLKIFMEGQINFINSINPHSDLFRKKLNFYKPALLAECNLILNTLK